MFSLGVIPARGGSRGIPRKNIVPVAGRPLLAYTCAAAKASYRLGRVILSTDNEEIAQVGREQGVDVPFLRPAAIAADDTPMIEVLKHALTWVEQETGREVDAVVVLQPTSPLREAGHVDAALDMLESSGADSVVSVVEVPYQFSPVSLMRLEAGALKPYLDGVVPTYRQDKPRLYARNGPAVLAVRRRVVLEGAGLYDGECRPLLMDQVTSLAIDTAWDLEVAEMALRRRARFPIPNPRSAR
jgi:CMP-N-acetylneuraminic acid synthetase